MKNFTSPLRRTLMVLFAVFAMSTSAFSQITVTINSSVPNPTNITSFQVEIQFSVEVTGFEVGDISVTNGFAMNLIDMGNPYFTVDINPTVEGEVTVFIPAEVCVDFASGLLDNSGSNTLSTFFDITPPTLNPVTIHSNNSFPMLAKPGDEITISITASEYIQNISATVFDEPASVFYLTGNDWYITYITSATNDEGIVPFEIYFEDMAGNDGTSVVMTTDATSVTFDKTEPIGYTVIFDQAMVDETNETAISFTISYAEVGASYDYTITSSGGFEVVTDWGEVTDIDYIVSGINVSGLLDGELTLSVTLKDMAGNFGTPAVNFVTKDTQGGGGEGTPPAAGDGSVGSPYEIETLDNLLWLSLNESQWSMNFLQTADLVFNETDFMPGGNFYNEGEGWIPIGNVTTKFTGTYNGQYFTIDGIFISRSGYDNQGLFGWVDDGALIENLGLTNVYIFAQDNIGGIAGQSSNSSLIRNCYVTGSINSRNNAAGIAGTLTYSSLVEYCYNNCTIAGTGNSIGGLVGYSGWGGDIKNSYNVGNVSGNEYVGGISGFNGSAVINCYSTGTVTGTSNVFALADVGWGTVSNSFWDTQTSGIASSAGGTGLTTDEMHNQATYIGAGWDFIDETINGTNDYWGINPTENNGYPFLAWQGYTHDLREYITDIDGNAYPTLVIGDQTWLGKNLRVTRYSDYMDIPYVDDASWDGLNSGAYTIYPYDQTDLSDEEEVLNTYGALYNWYAVGTEKLCPVGWRVPTNTEWQELIDFLTNNGHNGTEGDALKSTSGWDGVGNGTDNYLFTAFPGGNRVWGGGYSDAGFEGYWWSATSTEPPTAEYFSLSSESQVNYIFPNHSRYGYSIRCIKEVVFSGGSGTEMDPYKISTLADLDSLSKKQDHWDKYFIQTTDIAFSPTDFEMGGEFYNEGQGWIPIGTDFQNSFQGTYDGGGHSISGLYTNRMGIAMNQGLFGYTNNSTIKNLSVVDADISGDNNVGILAGNFQFGSIENCHTSGLVNGTNAVAGLIGNFFESEINNSSSSSNVNGLDQVGGLFGYCYSSTITNCYSIGSIVGVSKVGGLAGWVLPGSIFDDQVINSFSACSVSGDNDLGGLIGGNGGMTKTRFSFWDIQASGLTTSLGGIGKTTADMTDIPLYVQSGWDFKGWGSEGIWNIGNGRNNGYPYISMQYPGDPAPPARDIAPVAYTDSLYNVTATSATVRGEILFMGSPAAIWHGFCWNTTGNPTMDDTFIDLGGVTETGLFSYELTGLTTNTTYYVRAFAKNNEGTSYGKVLFFIPLNAPAGTGTELDPYLISSIYDLLWVQLNPTEWVTEKYFEQTADIDATITTTLNNSEGWMPIGNWESSFMGNYNGNGHTIDGLFINRLDYTQGLFGRMNNASVIQLALTNVNITGKIDAGALVGYAEYSDIQLCFSTGTVIGETNVGGLAGNMSQQNSVSNCYSMVNVSGVDYVGGLIGYDYWLNSIDSCYSAGIVISEGTYVGGLVGYTYSSSSMHCFWDTESSGQITSTIGTGLTTSQMLSGSSFPNWDFTNIWAIEEGASYPYLQWQVTPGEHNYPKGTETNPYVIANLNDLKWLSETQSVWSKHFIQTTDINASETAEWNHVDTLYLGWSPIGNFSTYFTGTYDGGYHTISGLFINRTSETQGFFGYAHEATIKNLGLVDVNITGNSNTGGLAGAINMTNISDCFSSGSISGYDFVGGLFGSSDGGSTISNSFSNTNVTGDSRIGGLTGYCNNDSISNCYSMGILTNIGTDEFFSQTGGLVGVFAGSILNSYSACEISSEYTVGGLIASIGGDDEEPNEITFSFWDTEVSGIDYSVGGKGKTTAQLTNFHTFIQSAWDFKDWGSEGIWNIGNGRNNGYPYFDWQFPGDAAQPLQDIPAGVSTDSLEFVNATTTMVYGSIFYVGTPNATQHGFCWNTTGEPTIADDIYSLGPVTETGPFTAEITGLIANTSYYVRAYATNDVGTSYGEELFFIPVNPPSGNGTMSTPYQISSIYDLLWVQQNPSEWVADKYFEQTDNISASVTANWNKGEGWWPIGFYENTESFLFRGYYNGGGHIIDSLYINRSQENYQGLFGSAMGATISNLGITNANITAKSWAGILIGDDAFSTISNCFTDGTVTGFNYLGGLISSINTSQISNCYSTATVMGSDYLGGLVAINWGSIINSYSTGSVKGDGIYVGGFLGENYGNITNCFCDTESSGQDISAGGSGKTTLEMTSIVTFTTEISPDVWDFTNTWVISEGETYPYFQWQGTPGDHNYPKGTETNPYIIATLADLKWLSNTHSVWGKYFIQTADLVFNETDFEMGGDFYNDGEGFLPIGNITTQFTGTYIGNNHIIDGLFINSSSSDQGLFGNISGASIKKLGVTNVYITGDMQVGGLAGSAQSGSEIDSCYTTGIINGDGYYAGGLIGLVGSSNVTRSYSSASVTGVEYDGGLIGQIDFSTILNSYSLGDVNGYKAGGLVGNANNSNIENCYSTGSVNINASNGGLVGTVFTSTATNSYWDTQTSGQASSPIGIGKTTADMQTQLTYTDWDFETIWAINPSNNDGYPYLQWQQLEVVETIFITDIRDFQQYPIVQIGEQLWLAKNLRETKYLNEDPIPTGLDNIPWSETTEGAFAIYQGIDGLSTDAQVLEAYGALYNGYAVDDFRGLCPVGWHVPTDQDWATLIDIADGESFAGGKLKSILTAPNAHPRWESPNTSATDEYGFSALPGGSRNSNGELAQIGSDGYWWASSEIGTDNAWFRGMFSNNNFVGRFDGYKGWGFSIRCLRDTDLFDPFGYLLIADSAYKTIGIEGIEFNQPNESQTFYLVNQGSEELEIINISNNLFEFTADVSLSPIAPGGKIQFITTFYTEVAGVYNDVLTITCTDPNQSTIEVPLKATIPAFVTTNTITNISATTATSGGEVTDDGGEPITAHGVVWNTTENPTLDVNLNYTTDGTGSGPWVSELTGLDTGTSYFVRAYATNSLGTAYGEQFIFTTLVEVTIGGTFTVEDKDYNGTLDATIESNSLTLIGVEGGDDVTLEGIVLEFVQSTVGVGIDVNIIDASLGGSDALKYSLSLTSTPKATATINPMKIFITPDAGQGKIYGDTDPAEYTFTHSGLIGVDVLTGAMEREVGENAGEHAYTLGTLDAGSNYMIMFDLEPAIFTITPRELTITANSFSKTFGIEYIFDGNEFISGTLYFSDLVTSCDLLSDGATAMADVGTYQIIPSNAQGTGLENYSITYVPGTLSVLDKTELTITGLAADNKVYDGNATATISNWGTLGGIVGDDEVYLDTTNAEINFNDKYAGTGKTVTVTGLELFGADADKYIIGNPTTTANITSRQLILSNFTADNKVYDGTTDVTGIAFDDDRIEGDDVIIGYDAYFASKNAGTGKPVNIAAIAISGGTHGGNYNLTTTFENAYADIFPKELVIEGTFTVFDKEYDGTPDAVINENNLAIFGVIEPDDVSLVNVIAQFTTADVGENIVVEILNADLSGMDASNYTLSLVEAPTCTANIYAPSYTLTLYSYPFEIEPVLVGAGSYTEGQEVLISTGSVDGYEFTKWSGSALDTLLLADPSAMVTSFIMPNRNVEFTANFSEIIAETYTLNLLVDPAGNGDVYGAGQYLAGEEVYVEVITFEGFQFVSWKDEEGLIISEEPSFYYLMPENNSTLTAYLEPLLPQLQTLTINIDGNGSVLVDGSPYTEVITVDNGTVLYLEAFPDEGWFFQSWNGDLMSSIPFESITMDADKIITATFTSQSSIYVTTDADDGFGSLRWAIFQANQSPTPLSIAFSIEGSDIINIYQDLIIQNGVTINGYNLYTGNNVTVQVAEPSISEWRVFTIDAPSYEVNISNMTINGGNLIAYLESGAGIIITENTLVNLDNIQVSGSHAFKGGAIFTQGYVTLSNSIITENHAQVFGGGIYNHGNLSLFNSSVTNNSISTGNPGKGIFTSGGTLHVDGSQVKGNSWGSKFDEGFDLSVGIGNVELIGSEVGSMHIGTLTDSVQKVKNRFLKEGYEGYDVVLIMDNSTIDSLLAYDDEIVKTGKANKAGFAIGGLTGPKGDGGSIGGFNVNHQVDILNLSLSAGEVNVENGNLGLTETQLTLIPQVKRPGRVTVHLGSLAALNSSISGEGDEFDLAVSYGDVTLNGSTVGSIHLGIAPPEGSGKFTSKMEGYEGYDIVLLLENSSIDSLLAFDEEIVKVGKANKAGFAIGGLTGPKGDGGSIGGFNVNHQVDMLNLSLSAGEVNVENGDLGLTETQLTLIPQVKRPGRVTVHLGSLAALNSSISGEGDEFDLAVSYGDVTLSGSTVGSIHLGITPPEGSGKFTSKMEGYEGYDIVLLLENSSIDSLLAFDEEIVKVGKANKAGFAIGGLTGPKGNGGSIGGFNVNHQVDMLNLSLSAGEVNVENGNLGLTETQLTLIPQVKGSGGVTVHMGSLAALNSSISGEGDDYDLAVSYGDVTLSGSTVGSINLGITPPEGSGKFTSKMEGYEGYDIVLLLENSSIDSLLAFDEEIVKVGKANKAGFAIGGLTGPKGKGGSIGDFTVSHQVDILNMELNAGSVNVENGDLGLLDASLNTSPVKEGEPSGVIVHWGSVVADKSSILGATEGYDLSVSYGSVILNYTLIGNVNFGIAPPDTNGSKRGRTYIPEGYEDYDIVMLMDSSSVNSIFALDEEIDGTGKANKAGFAIGGLTGPKGFGGMIGDLTVKHEVDLLDINLNTGKVTVNYGDLGLFGTQLTSNPVKSQPSKVFIHRGSLQAVNSSIFGSTEEYDLSVSYGSVMLNSSSINRAHFGAGPPKGMENQLVKEYLPEGYEEYDIVLLMDNSSVNYLLALDEEVDETGKANKAGFAIGGLTGPKGKGGSIGDFTVSHQVDILNMELNTASVNVENGDLGLLDASLNTSPAKEGEPSGVLVHWGSVVAENSSILGATKGYDLSVSYGTAILNNSTVGGVNFGIAPPDTIGSKRGRTYIPEGYEDYDIVMLMDSSSVNSIFALDEEIDGTGKANKAGFAIGGLTGPKGNGGNIGDLTVKHEVDMLDINLYTGKVTVNYGDLGIFNTALTSNPVKDQPSKVFVHRGSLQSENSSIFGSTESYDISVSYGSVMLNSSSINKAHLGAKGPKGDEYTKPSKYIPEGYEEYDIVLLMDNSTVNQLLALDMDDDSTGKANKAGFAIGGLTGPKGKGNSIGELNVEHEVDLRLIEGSFSSDIWQITNGELNISRFGSTAEADILAQTITINGGTLASGEGKNAKENISISSNSIVMSSSAENSFTASQLILGGNTTLLKPLADKEETFIQIGSGCAVTLSGNCSVNAGEALAFDISDEGSLIVESDNVVIIGNVKVQGLYRNQTGFVSAPIANVTIPSMNYELETWSETEFEWMPNTDNIFAQMKGYKATFEDQFLLIEFLGNLPPASQSTSLTNSAIAEINTGGWNLVGNPFTSAIDFEVVAESLNGIENVVYTWDNIAQNFRVYQQGGLAINGGTQLIGVARAFFMKANQENATLGFGTGKTHNVPGLLNLKKVNTKSTDDHIVITVTSADGNKTDQTLVAILEGASDTYTSGLDAVKLFAPGVPQLFTLGNSGSSTNDVALAINTIDIPFAEVKTVPMNIRAIADEQFTITTSGGTSKRHLTAFLEDLVTGDITEISDGGNYTFTNSEIEDRFLLYFEYRYAVNFSVTEGFGTLIARVDGVEIASGDRISGAKDVVFTASPSYGYRISGWTINGVLLEDYTQNTLVVNGIDEDVNITVAFESVIYTLTIAVDGQGTTMPAPGVYNHIEGSQVVLFASPFAGHQFDKWVVGAEEITTQAIMLTINADITATAYFVETSSTQFTLTVGAVGQGTTTPPAGNHIYNDGSVALLNATPAFGWEFEKWVINDVEVTQNPTQTTMDADKEAIAHFLEKPKYTLTVTIEGNGSVEVNGTPYTVALEIYEGETAMLNAIATAGWQFDGWSGDIESTNAQTNILMTEDKSVTATFTQIQHTLTISILGEGSVNVNGEPYTQAITAVQGTTLSLEAIAAEGWQFVGWIGDLVSTNANESITMNANKTIVAQFVVIPPPTYTLTIAIVGQGTTLPLPGDHQYTAGTDVVLFATPAANYTFEKWVVGEVEYLTPAVQITITGDITATAHFIENTTPQYTLTVSIVGNGSVEVNDVPYTVAITVDEGTVLNLEAIADEGWQFAGWTGDLTSTNANTTITMNANKAITATFTVIPPPQYTLTISIVGNGTVEVDGDAYTVPITVDEGTVLDLEAIADESWEFDEWSGDLVSTDATESITMDGNKAVTATFTFIDNVQPNIFANLRVFPNPFTASIKVMNAKAVKQVTITNIVGQRVMEISLDGAEQVSIPTSELVKGTYMIIFQAHNGERMIRKMVKE